MDWGDHPIGAAPSLIRAGARYCVGARFPVGAVFAASFMKELSLKLANGQGVLASFAESLEIMGKAWTRIYGRILPVSSWYPEVRPLACGPMQSPPIHRIGNAAGKGLFGCQWVSGNPAFSSIYRPVDFDTEKPAEPYSCGFAGKKRGAKNGARYRVRTCDPYRVKVVLYH